jgi:hypothetical protein
MIFGKPLSRYIAFQKVFLILIAVIGIVRLVVSLAGAPNTTARFFSMSAVAVIGVFYYGLAVPMRGFGGYRHLLPLCFFQVVLANIIAVFGILLTIAGLHNIYGAIEYSGPFPAIAQNQWAHAAAHLTVGMVVPTVLNWAVASLVMLITRLVTGRSPGAVRA